MQDFHMEGVGNIHGGEFGTISVEGVGNCSGDIKADTIRVEGVFNCSGKVEARYLDCEGVANFRSNIRAKKITVEGVLSEKSGNKIEAEEIICEGVIKTGGEISADIIRAAGSISADEIVGDNIRIDSDWHPRHFFRFFNRTRSDVRLIEATTIELSGVNAMTVNGKDITIGPECRIENIDCSGMLSIDRSSVVKNITGEYTRR